MGLLSWIVMGLIAGAVAKMVTKSGGGWVSSLIVGLIGGVVGGWIGSAIFNHGVTSVFSLYSWLLAIGGSVLVLWVYNMMSGRKR